MRDRYIGIDMSDNRPTRVATTVYLQRFSAQWYEFNRAAAHRLNRHLWDELLLCPSDAPPHDPSGLTVVLWNPLQDTWG